MNDFLIRLENEQIELSEKISKLDIFIASEKFKKTEPIQQSLLFIQSSAMKTYFYCLTQRLTHLEQK